MLLYIRPPLRSREAIVASVPGLSRSVRVKSQKFIDTAQCEHEYTNTQLISVKLAKVTQNTEMELL